MAGALEVDRVGGPDSAFRMDIVDEGSLYFSAVRDDTLGRRDSYRAQYKEGEFEAPVNLGPGVNGPTDEGDIFVSPDESYLIHVSAEREDALGSSDLYISFREDDGSWSHDIHMGDVINSEESDYCPAVFPDGKYFFFTRGDDVMWVDAAIIDSYRE